MAKDGLDEQEQAALDKFDAQLDTARQVADLEISVINQQYALCKQGANEETVCAKAREGAKRTRRRILAGATMASVFNPDNPERLEKLKEKFGELGGAIEGGKMILAGFSADLKNLGPEGGYGCDD